MKLRINPFNRGNPLGLKDAAVISIVMAVANYFIGFLAGYSYAAVRADVGSFVFESVKTLGGSFFASLITLAGLEKLVQRGDQD